MLCSNSLRYEISDTIRSMVSGSSKGLMHKVVFVAPSRMIFRVTS